LKKAAEVTREAFKAHPVLDSWEDNLNRIRAKITAYEQIVSAYENLFKEPKIKEVIQGEDKYIKLPEDVIDILGLDECKEEVSITSLCEAIRGLGELTDLIKNV